jgi:hypothetical protein
LLVVRSAERSQAIERKASGLDRARAGIEAPDAWFAAMRVGDFERAWEISDEVLRRRRATGATCWHWPRHLQFVWSGVPLAGKRVLVRCYHGLGDTIQFIRFAARLREAAREVLVWAQPSLLSLVATADGVDRVLPLHDGTPEAEYDADIEIMELPHALRIAFGSLPGPLPYLRLPAIPRDPMPHGDGLRVGLVWEAGGWDPRRSLPTAVVSQLAGVRGVRLFSLQRGPAREQAAALGATDISTESASEAAARMSQLDLIISVDTMAAHLAGALGLPVWTLLQAECDWRWMDRAEDTPWYPTMRLFRQPWPGDWDWVMDQVLAALHAHLG